MTVSEILADFLRGALDAAVAGGHLPGYGSVEIEIERPRQEEFGDFASGAAFLLARSMGKAPMEIAQALVEQAPRPDFLSSMSAEAPGFINFRLSPQWLQDNLAAIEEQGSGYGGGRQGEGKRVQVEFVSANPNGPLHVGHARGAVIGSALANLLRKAGYDVQCEYYLNDGGSQMRQFGESLYARVAKMQGVESGFDAEAYSGRYMDELAAAASAQFPGLGEMGQQEGLAALERFGLEHCVGMIKGTLERLNVHFDSWFSERSMLESGQFQRILEELEAGDYIARNEGAVWFRTTRFGAEHDDVLIRSGDRGEHTYFATDIVYHHDKLARRKYDLAINVWGGDHHSHIARIRHALEALKCDSGRLVVLVAQMVHLQEGGERAKLSKRGGHVVLADELLDSVGADAARYVFLGRSASSQMTFDVELAKKRSSDNPIFYVQYAHARMASILRAAAADGLDYGGGDLRLLEHARERELMRALAEFPDMLSRAASKLEAHHVPFYAYELARALQRFYEECRVISEDKADAALTLARLRLVSAARTVLAEALRLMGMSAPDSM